MASNVRQQLKDWISTLEIHGSVLDVGGLKAPVKGRTKIWDVSVYKIFDIKPEWKGWKTDYVDNLEETDVYLGEEFDHVFCTEVLEYMINPLQAIWNLNTFLKTGGLLYLSTHFMYPHHIGGTDCLRFTRDGIVKILERSGFEIVSITPRLPLDPKLFTILIMRESKICKYPQEVGHMTIARKL